MNQESLQAYLNQEETPAYIFDLDMLLNRVQMMKKIFGERIEICYAMKANPFLIEPLKDVVDRFEVCSPGEFHICEHAGIPMEQIVLSGVNKEKKDITHAMQSYRAAGVYTIESKSQLELLEKCAKDENIVIRALIRVTSGNQFGVDEEELFDMISKKNCYPHVQLKGIQCYSGTQKKKISKIEKELHWLDGIITRLKESYNYEVEVLEYGPGFYVPYFENEEDVDDPALLGEFTEVLEHLEFQGKITLEMGRYIAAYCGYYITRIVDQKINHGQNYCIVDGGLNHLNYYGQAMAMKIPHHQHLYKEENRSGEGLWNICGSLCTVNDVLVKQMPLKDAKIGDALVFERVGAYSVTEGIYLFLSRRMPAIWFWSEKEGFRKIRKPIESYLINMENKKN